MSLPAPFELKMELMGDREKGASLQPAKISSGDGENTRCGVDQGRYADKPFDFVVRS